MSISKYKGRNEQIKQKYFRYLRKAKGYKENTIYIKKETLWRYDEYTGDDSYKHFNDKKAENFVEWLKSYKTKQGNPISLSRQFDILRHIRLFFEWLSNQPGYKRSIKHSDIEFFNLPRHERIQATSTKFPEYPHKEYVLKLLKSIKVKNDIDKRDKALIAFLYSTGIRISALLSLRIDCFDPKRLVVYQDPNRGVKTKNSKLIVTTIPTIEKQLIDIILKWYRYLTEKKYYSSTDPLFPRVELAHENENNFSFFPKGIEPKFYNSTNSVREMLKIRSKEANLKYYAPHAFRHSIANRWMNSVKNPEELRAVSQNLGHKNLNTTLTKYGLMTEEQVSQVIHNMDFKNE